MTQVLDFQTIILTLQNYWASQNCLIWQPYYSQVGAGTMNPATILRVLGPEPWNVAYVEPSIRPDDGRFGENPNRLQQHYQFQVILKPDPGNPQELYLKSLEALGIDPQRHDIRFVEDNWESPALGAWGLGWEVWLDGMEITQFTYFQQAGGMNLEPISVEITYGLERIAMALLQVRNFRDIRWNLDRLYGEVNLQGEKEHSKYYFEVADVERLRQMYELFEREAESALANKLVLPAHDYVLKCSHTFNVLDTRGAIGVTERQALFSRMRDLSRRIAEAYVAQRGEMGYPWNKKVDEESGNRAINKPNLSSLNLAGNPDPKIRAPFLFEIGTEELPVSDLQTAIAQLKERFPVLLGEMRLDYNDIQVMGTPRRLVVFIKELSAGQADKTLLVKGPPADRGFNPDGSPTKAAEGFARGKGLTVKDLEVQEIDGGRYVVAKVYERGKPAKEVLSALLPGLVAGIRFEKSMRWNQTNIAFSRPIRWLLALFDNQVIPFEYAGINTGRKTRLLRFISPSEVEIQSIDHYFTALSSQGIILDPQERLIAISKQVSILMKDAGGEPQPDTSLLEEVTMLVEAPTALSGHFDESYLKLPSEVLISVMKKHQRYFPIKSIGGKLLPCFVAVRNGDDRYLDVVMDGNEQVVRARFADAAFFIKEDSQHKFEELIPKLGTLTFQVKLGSMLDKSKRVEKLVEALFSLVSLDENDKATARRAAHLCKADLVSHMVIEMTSLQGIIGQYYAFNSGESEGVAQAIFEHYLPRYAGDVIPSTKPGMLIGLADRLDTLIGLFAAGLAPTGAKDPFALRRAALGLVQNLISWNLDFDLQKSLDLAAEKLPIEGNIDVRKACLEFIAGRMRNALIDEGARYDVVDAVLAVQYCNPAGAKRAVDELLSWIGRDDWGIILPAFSRCVRIIRDQKEKWIVRPECFVETAEFDLYNALLAAESTAMPKDSVKDLFSIFLPMIPFINRFFEQVMVMVEDQTLRQNRLGLLQRISDIASGVADLSLLEGF